MTKDDIIRMAHEAGWEMDDSCVLEPQVVWYISQGQLERFAALVAAAENQRLVLAWQMQPPSKSFEDAIKDAIAAEREACIRDCDSVDLAGADDCIAAIRARGQG